jgi:peptidoglycan/LPS O-acetylase OafA/YrhL
MKISEIPPEITSSFLHYANIWYYLDTSSYFATDRQNSFTLHFWSLALEEQFYFLIPPLLLLLYYLLSVVHYEKLFQTSIVIGSLLSLLFIFILPQQAKFFLLFPRIWEFMIGALLFVNESLLSKYTNRLGTISLIIFKYLSLSILILMSILITDASYPNYTTLIVCLLTMIFLSIPGESPSYAMEMIGNWSYSIYLYHWPIKLFLNSVFIRTSEPYSDVLYYSLFFLFLTVASLGSYYLIEKPVLKFTFSPYYWILVFIICSVIPLLLISFTPLIIPNSLPPANVNMVFYLFYFIYSFRYFISTLY